MTKRIFRSIIVVSLAALLAALLLIVAVLHSYFEKQTETDLHHQAATISHGVVLDGLDYLENLRLTSRVTWVDKDGTVLYDNRENAENMQNHIEREEIKQAMKTGSGTSSRHSDTMGQETLYYAVRMEDGTVLRVSSTRYSIWSLVLRAMQPMLLVVAAAFALASFLAARLAKKITKPINEMDLNNPDDESNELYDELAPLMMKLRTQNLKIAEQVSQLKKQQKEFSAITENMSEGFLVLDVQTHVLSYNTAALRLLKTDLVPLPAETQAFVLSRERNFRQCVEEMLNGHRSERTLKNETQCLHIIASPVMQDGRQSGGVVVIMDITEREQRDRLRREFTANVSHELKTPLTAISGTAEILENGLVKPEDIAHFAGNIHREAGRLIGLVNDIIKLSRLDEGDINDVWGEFDIYEIAKGALEQVESAAKSRNIKIELRGYPVFARGVKTILEEIIYNLCDNAVAYNKDGGNVIVTAEDNDGAQIVIEDTGVGISDQEQSRIFERFYRVDKSHSNGGTGLGLSIVKHGAAYLGAAIMLESREGQGSRFTLKFPVEY